MTDIDQFRSALILHGFKVSGNRAQCSGHGGKGLSLAFSAGSNGQLVTHCHSHGCSHKEVLTGVGLWGNKDSVREYNPPVKSPEETKEDLEWEKFEQKQNQDNLARLMGEAVANSHENLVSHLRFRGIKNTPPTLDMGFVRYFSQFPFMNRPALIFAIKNVKGKTISAEIYVQDGNGEIKKRFLDDLPRDRGHIVIAEHSKETIYLTEGIITGFSIAEMMLPERVTVWSCCGSGGLKKIVLPEWFRVVYICADNDHPGINAANELKKRLEKEGRIVHILMPEKEGFDWNDSLQESLK